MKVSFRVSCWICYHGGRDRFGRKCRNAVLTGPVAAAVLAKPVLEVPSLALFFMVVAIGLIANVVLQFWMDRSPRLFFARRDRFVEMQFWLDRSPRPFFGRGDRFG